MVQGAHLPHRRILLAELGGDFGMVRVLHHAQQVMVHQYLRPTHCAGVQGDKS